MGVPTTTWDETAPAGSANISQGDNRIRELKTQLREVIAVDHEMTSIQSAATGGQHKKMTLQTTANLGTGASSASILGVQGTAASGQLVWTTEADSDIVVCNTTGVNAPSITGVYAAANVAAIATMMNLIYPVGIVITLGVSTNPGTLLGVGTWAAITGTVIVGKAAAGTFNTLDATGGAETVKLTSAESGVPAHTHIERVNGGGSGGVVPTYVAQAVASAIDSGTATKANTAADAASAHTNLQPYIVKYVWQRTV